MHWRLAWIGTVLLVVGGCEGQSPAATEGNEESGDLSAEGEVVEPPFAVRGDAEGLLLVWYDTDGAHTANRREDIPADHRSHVRVDSLTVAPEDRLAPEFVYLADLREPGPNGTYRVRKVRRDAIDALIDRENPPPAAATGEDVVVYGASWCGACRSVAAYLRQKNIPFVEKDIEREPGAREEMQEKARRAGIATTGIPVIDFRGTILTGFNPQRLDELIGAT